MGVKKVKDLKQAGMRIPAMEWAKALKLLDLTTKEWDLAVDLKSLLNMSDTTIRKVILIIRKVGWKKGEKLLSALFSRD